MSNLKNFSIIPIKDYQNFINNLGEYLGNIKAFKLDNLVIIIYESRNYVEEVIKGKNWETINDTNNQLHISIDKVAALFVRGNIQLGSICNLSLERTNGFSIPFEKIYLLREDPLISNIIKQIINFNNENSDSIITEYCGEDELYSTEEENSYNGLISKNPHPINSKTETSKNSPSYSMRIESSFNSQSEVVLELLNKLPNRFEELEIDFAVATIGGWEGEYENANSYIGPYAFIQGTINNYDFYISDTETNIEELEENIEALPTYAF